MNTLFQPFTRFFQKKSEQILFLESVLDCTIHQPKLFIKAITHSNDKQNNYERLEFLGDAVLDSIVSDWLYRHYAHLAEGQLTILRARFVSRESLAKFAESLQINQIIQSETLNFEIVNSSNRRVLGDILESIIGALYIEKGYKGVQRFVEKKLLTNNTIVNKIIAEPKNFKGLLLEKGRKESFNVRFGIENFDGQFYLAVVFINESKLAYGRGRTKKKAEQNAAKYIIEHPDLLKPNPNLGEEE